MTHSIFLDRDEPKRPTNFYLSTPLYLATTVFSLAGCILLTMSGDGYSYRDDDSLLFPITALFVSLMTGPLRCFFWALSFCVQVKWVRSEDRAEAQIRLDDGEDEIKGRRRYAWIGQVLLSWNAWLAITLTASLGVLMWRFIENRYGRALFVQAGFGAAFLGIACVLHALLATPGFGSRQFTVLRYPFEEGYQSKGAEEEGA